MKQRASKSLLERVQDACEKDNTIVCARDKVSEVSGFAESYFEYLGLSRTDLKKLESTGLALRGYARGTTRGGGHSVRWILITDAVQEGEVDGR